jgi:hypothetical protein
MKGMDFAVFPKDPSTFDDLREFAYNGADERGCMGVSRRRWVGFGDVLRRVVQPFIPQWLRPAKPI